MDPKPKIDLTIKNKFRAGDNSPMLKSAVAELQREQYANHTVRYSDGSKFQGKTGIGIVDVEVSTFFRLPDPCSVFSAEAAAAFIAVTTPAEKPIAVFTDSASVMHALTSDTSHHHWVQEIQSKAPPNATFIWIPGHCGIKGNEEADHLAATGRQATLYTTDVPGQDLKQWITTKIRAIWSADWYRVSTLFIRKIKGDTNRWTDVKDHYTQKVISRLRTGHTRVSHNLTGSGPFHITCGFCNVRNTVEHFISNCQQYHGPREFHGIPGSIRDALSDDPPSIAALVNFLKDINLYKSI